MKKIFIAVSIGKFINTYCILAIIVFIAIILIIKVIAGAPGTRKVFGPFEEDEINYLSKENGSVKEILKSIVPVEEVRLYETDNRGIGRNITDNPGLLAVIPKLHAEPLREAAVNGRDVAFSLLLDDPNYIRPVYDPGWKGFFFRGWLYLPYKNLDARHKLFIFPMGGSSNFDFSGSQGLDRTPAVDFHKYINLLVYGFNVEKIKRYKDQVVISGRTSRRGVQAVSIVQDQLLDSGEDQKLFLFQLSTPDGCEIDYIYGNVYKLNVLMKEIKENTVKAEQYDSGELDKLIDKNMELKKELYYYLPVEDRVIRQDIFKTFPPEFPHEVPDITSARFKGTRIPYRLLYEDSAYKRPVYDPLWQKNYKNRWCFLPEQMTLSMGRFFAIPHETKAKAALLGKLGLSDSSLFSSDSGNEISNFGDVISNINDSCFILYGFRVKDALYFNNRILIIGEPHRTGIEIISLAVFKAEKDYIVSLTTPDDCEVDFDVIYAKKHHP